MFFCFSVKQVSKSSAKQRVITQPSKLLTTRSELRLPLSTKHFQDGQLRAKCVASMLTMHWQSLDVTVKEESPTLASVVDKTNSSSSDVSTVIHPPKEKQMTSLAVENWPSGINALNHTPYVTVSSTFLFSRRYSPSILLNVDVIITDTLSTINSKNKRQIHVYISSVVEKKVESTFVFQKSGLEKSLTN